MLYQFSRPANGHSIFLLKTATNKAHYTVWNPKMATIIRRTASKPPHQYVPFTLSYTEFSWPSLPKMRTFKICTYDQFFFNIHPGGGEDTLDNIPQRTYKARTSIPVQQSAYKLPTSHNNEAPHHTYRHYKTVSWTTQDDYFWVGAPHVTI